MMRNLGKAIILILVVTQLVMASASLSIEPDRVVPNEAFIVNLVVPINEIPKVHQVPRLKDLKGMTLLKIDSTDETQRTFFRSINVRKYRFHLKSPSAGEFKLGPLVWNINGKDQVLGSASVDVKRGYDAPGLSVNIFPNKKSVYVGEQIRLDLRLDIYENFQGNLRWSSADLGNDFWAKKNESKGPKSKRSSRSGVMQELNDTYAFIAPMKAGKLKIKPAKFDYTKQGAPKVKEIRNGNMYSRTVSSEPIEASAFSRPLTITAKPLPGGAPASFSGLTGQYSFSAIVDSTSLKVGEALTLNVKISGNGRPSSIPDIKLPSFDDFRSVPPESNISTKVSGGKLWTTREIKIYLYPKKKGDFVINEIKFSYFDPNKKGYVEKVSGPFNIHVEKGDQSQIPENVASGMMYADKKEIESLGKDIRYIHKDTSFQVKDYLLYKQLWFWLLLFSPFVFVFVLKTYYRSRLNKLGDKAFLRRKKANQLLNEHLKKAKKELQTGEGKAFYAELDKGLNDYISDKFNLELRGMTLATKIKTLADLGYNQETLDDYKDFNRVCEYSQFSSGINDKGEMKKSLERADALLKKLESKS